jgi:hypothetical protein
MRPPLLQRSNVIDFADGVCYGMPNRPRDEGRLIDVMMDYTYIPPIPAQKIPEDIYNIKQYDTSDGPLIIRECKLCGAKGIEEVIHLFACQYSSSKWAALHATVSDEFSETEFGTLPVLQRPINKHLSESVFQHEFVYRTKLDPTVRFLGSYGAVSCVIVAIWNRVTHETLLAHIDALTIGIDAVLKKFDAANSDVYVVGGKKKTFVHDVLSCLQRQSFEVTYAKVGKGYLRHELIVDCDTGGILVDDGHTADLLKATDSSLRMLYALDIEKKPLQQFRI